MNIHLLKLHYKLIALVALFIVTTFTMTFSIGQLRPTSDIDFIDTIGEGGIAVITFLWLFFTLISRPAGRVTNLLVIGVLFVHVSLLLDLLDEFLIYPSEQTWLTAYESAPAPIGMILMTIALYQWHQEQMTLIDQLSRRERDIREHSLSDKVTGLYCADYMLKHIENEIRQVALEKRHFCLLMIDIDNFDAFVRRFGDLNGDRLLREFANLILMNIRTYDLACRYAGDRFIVLLPDCQYSLAVELASQLQSSISHLAFKPEGSSLPIYHHISVSLVDSRAIPVAQDMLSELNKQMEQIKINKDREQAA